MNNGGRLYRYTYWLNKWVIFITLFLIINLQMMVAAAAMEYIKFSDG